MSRLLASSHHIEFYLEWAVEMLNKFGPQEDTINHTTLLGLHQSLQKKYESLAKVCDFNKYTLSVLQNIGKIEERREREGVDSGHDDNEDLMLISRQSEDEDEDDDVDMYSSSSE